MSANTTPAERAVSEAASRFTGAPVAVTITEEGLSFSIDCGKRKQALGGWVGGEHAGFIKRGQIFPRMTTGCDPIRGYWYEILQPIGWYD